MKCMKFLAPIAMAVALLIATQAGAALINGGFEDNASLGASPTTSINGWSGGGGGAKHTTSLNAHPARSGVGSLRLQTGGGFNVPVAFQSFPASAGQIWDFQGYMQRVGNYPAGAAEFAALKIVFNNAGGLPINPGLAGLQIGALDAAPNHGIVALPRLNNTLAANEWHFAQARGIAPLGTASVQFVALLVDEATGATRAAYFDDLRATTIPEPASMALLGLAAIMGGNLLARRRRIA